MDKERIKDALGLLNALLSEKGIKGEMCIYGGAAMCIAYDARSSTKDVDAVFKPAMEIRKAAEETAERLDLPKDWLNDGVKGFIVDHRQKVFLRLSNLTILIAEPDYLFAMKALAARVDTSDRDDIKLLLQNMAISSLDEALYLVEKYYPRAQIKPSTVYFLEELFDEDTDA